MLKREGIFTFSVSMGSYDEFVKSIARLPKLKESSYVCFANVHMVVESYFDYDFNTVVSGADIVAPDGKPLSLFLRTFNGLVQPKVSGPDIFVDLLKEAETSGQSVFFYGSSENVLQRILSRLRQEYPLLKIAGCYSPPFRRLTSEEDQEITHKINGTSPALIFVALGCPKQERWMAEHKGKIRGCMLGVGQAFQIYAGDIKRAPLWMQNVGLEWAFRLATEPRRLWKRYLFSNFVFMYLVLKHCFFQRSMMARGYKKLKPLH